MKIALVMTLALPLLASEAAEQMLDVKLNPTQRSNAPRLSESSELIDHLSIDIDNYFSRNRCQPIHHPKISPAAFPVPSSVA